MPAYISINDTTSLLMLPRAKATRPIMVAPLEEGDPGYRKRAVTCLHPLFFEQRG
jgi:hypothetical protein